MSSKDELLSELLENFLFETYEIEAIIVSDYDGLIISGVKKEKVDMGNGERHGAVRILGKNSIAYGHLRPALVQDIEVLEETASRIERYVKSL